MNRKAFEWIPFHDAKALSSTAYGLLVDLGMSGEVWVPHAEIHDESEVAFNGDEGTLIVTSYFAEKKGLIDGGSE